MGDMVEVFKALLGEAVGEQATMSTIAQVIINTFMPLFISSPLLISEPEDSREEEQYDFNKTALNRQDLH